MRACSTQQLNLKARITNDTVSVMHSQLWRPHVQAFNVLR